MPENGDNGNRWKRFGQWVGEQVRLTGKTQKEVAVFAGITEVQLSRIVNGNSGTKRETIPGLAEALGVDVDEAYERAGYSPDMNEGPEAEERRRVFGSRLDLALKMAAKSQREFAQTVGVSESIVTQWISGRKSPGFARVWEIASVLDCSTDWLYGDDTARAPAERRNTFIAENPPAWMDSYFAKMRNEFFGEIARLERSLHPI